MITLVTVTYNAAATLERTLLSVESQTYDDVVHIIMDGGSKDGTVDIANAYKHRAEARDREVVVVSEPDKGLYDAMNKALKLVEGGFVCFLNAGDKLHGNDVLQKVADVINMDKVAVIYGDTDIVDDAGNRLGARHLSPPEELTWKSFRNGMLVCHQSFYVNSEIAKEYNLDYRFSADFDWCIRCMKEGERFSLVNVNLHSVLTDYLSEGMTTANHRASLLERFRIMARHYGWVTTIAMHVWFMIRKKR